MILDTSALVAILLKEPGHEALMERVTSAPHCGIGSPTLVEAILVLSSPRIIGNEAEILVENFLSRFGVVTIPFGEAHWRAASVAFRRFGKGRHPAALNFGDCMSYAIASLAQQPLLAIGNDFPRTDLLLG